MIPVEGHKNLYLEESGAIVNTDTNGYANYMRAKNKKLSERREIEDLRNIFNSFFQQKLFKFISFSNKFFVSFHSSMLIETAAPTAIQNILGTILKGTGCFIIYLATSQQLSLLASVQHHLNH